MAARAAQGETVFVLLHGRGGEPASMQALAQQLDLPGAAVVTPAAPGGSWYPERFMQPRAANEPHLSEALARVHRTLDELEAEAGEPGRIVLGGFSQGACLACEALARRPRPLGALVVICGGLIGADDELADPPDGALDGLQVLLTATEEDHWVPVERVERTAGILRAAGASVDLHVHPPAEHQIHDEEVDAFRRLAARLGGRDRE